MRHCRTKEHFFLALRPNDPNKNVPFDVKW